MSKNVDEPDPRYQRGCIYTLRCLDPATKDFYVGSTINLPRRFQYHRLSMTDERKCKAHMYSFIANHGGMDNWCPVLLEEFPCWSKKQLERRENWWFNKLKPTLNTNIPGLFASLGEDPNALARHRYAQRKLKNPDSLRQYLAGKSKRYREKHAEAVKVAKAKPYLCECGSVCQMSNAGKHRRSWKHQEFVRLTYGSDLVGSAPAGTGGEDQPTGPQDEL
jgi:group I intron endonuclease